MKAIRSVDEYIANVSRWHNELKRLREILLSTGLTEEVKWGSPCYTARGRNVVGMAAFKSYFGLWFFQGALLTDNRQVLINAQPGKTRALRQWRMMSAREIQARTIKRYVKEAVKIAGQGRRVAVERKQTLVVPAELRRALEENKIAGENFDKLKPGQRRAYAEYIAEAKRNDTKLRRLEEILPMISAGAGPNDKYR
jgi:uncharacterized protein YdeI (YjbR/CyaY-like superfamily)